MRLLQTMSGKGELFPGLIKRVPYILAALFFLVAFVSSSEGKAITNHPVVNVGQAALGKETGYGRKFDRNMGLLKGTHGLATSSESRAEAGKAVSGYWQEATSSPGAVGEKLTGPAAVVIADIVIGAKGMGAAGKATKIANTAGEVAEVGGKTAAQISKGISSGSETVNAGAALRSKLAALEDAQVSSAKTRELSDGRIRYYGKETPAKKPGLTRGASYVTEYKPSNGDVRSWMESYNHAGKVNRVHPQMKNGQQMDSRHYPPTAKELEK